MKTIPVRELAYFVYQEGNLTSQNNFNQSAEDGRYLHQLRQSEYDSNATKEYYVEKEIEYDNEIYTIHGFIDGLLDNKNRLILEEIKTTDKDVYNKDFIELPEHLAQLKIYAYLMLIDSKFDKAELNLLYIERGNYIRRNFKYTMYFEELKDFFYDTLREYISFLNLVNKIEENRIKSTNFISFPYQNIREPQIEMSNFLKENLLKEEFNFILAPTGVGKTVVSVFEAIKKMINYNDKVFFLTAKTSGKNIVKDTMEALKNNGYLGKTLFITAKKKICLAGKEICDPDNCIFAKGFYKKLKPAILDILNNEDIIDESKVLEYSNKYELCSFEFSLNLSMYVGLIVCDYNYLFDPKAKLVRFFEDNKFNNLILVDEAHNLVSRSQKMYSSSISIYDLLSLKNYIADDIDLFKKVNKTIKYLNDKYYDLLSNDNYFTNELDIELESNLLNISDSIDLFLEEHEEIVNREKIVEKSLIIKDFLRIAKLYSDNHIFLVKNENNNLTIYLNCLDASDYISNIVLESTKGITFFSATLYPIEYYKKMLIGHNEMKYLELKSPFDYNRLGLFISPISTRYNYRYQTEPYITSLINETINFKKGKYIVFFPSYQYLNLFVDKIDTSNYDLIVQREGLTEFEQREILKKFDSNDNVLGLFVLGGVFAEGIDFIGDRLHGVIIVGVGLPQINLENEILRNHFNEENLDGFDYAYTYPGFNKVVQAAGRVIRTEQDKGIVILVDDRYLYKKYLSIFPQHWKNYQRILSNDELVYKLDNFWSIE